MAALVIGRQKLLQSRVSQANNVAIEESREGFKWLQYEITQTSTVACMFKVLSDRRLTFLQAGHPVHCLGDSPDELRSL